MQALVYRGFVASGDPERSFPVMPGVTVARHGSATSDQNIPNGGRRLAMKTGRARKAQLPNHSEVSLVF